METNIIQLASTILDFGRVNRQTFHQDGLLSESDTDHTVMLGIVAASLAKKMYSDLDIGLITQFALVHDLVEVYAGDTPTLMDVGEDFLKKKQIESNKRLKDLKVNLVRIFHGFIQ